MFVHVVVIMSLGRVLDDKASMEFSRLAPCECPRPSENVALAPLVLATTDPTQPPTEDSVGGRGNSLHKVAHGGSRKVAHGGFHNVAHGGFHNVAHSRTHKLSRTNVPDWNYGFPRQC